MQQIINKGSNRQSWPMKALTVSVTIALMCALVPANSAPDTSTRKKIGDLEIYKAAKPGTASIFMMLDTSGSMAFYDKDCKKNSDKQLRPEQAIRLVIYKRKLAPDSTSREVKFLLDESGQPIKDFNNVYEELTYTPTGCLGADNKLVADRLTRLQMALLELLADDVYNKDGSLKPSGTLADNYEIGLGNYSHSGDGRSGVVLVPTKALTAEQRFDLINTTKGLTAKGGTPTAHALAESGAYMMGTTTGNEIKVVAEREYRGSTPWWRRCNTNSTSFSLDYDSKRYVKACKNESSWTAWSKDSDILPSYDNYTSTNNSGRIYYKGSDNKDSGFINSVDIVKKGDENRYLSPLNTKECSGNGIYLLTDGKPELSTGNDAVTEGNNRAKQLMNTSLLGSISLPDRPTALSVSSCNSLSGGSSSGAWGCMAEYAALLRNTDNNPLKRPIKIATVGFGKEFDGLTVTRDIVINGKSKTVIDCTKGTANDNTRNLCKLGERKGDTETKTFGDGGFYYTEESSEIAASIIDFASGLVQIINTAPSGTITIPEDPYRTANQLPYAYLPMLDPEIVSPNSIWKGNLKKYNLDQGTLFGNGSKKLYKDIAGNLDKDTQDVWQSTDFVVEGSTANNTIEAGGVYAQLLSPNSGLTSVRTLYVEDYTSDNVKTPILRKLSVSSAGKPMGFNDLKDTVAYSELNKRRLLSFLGFDVVLTDNGTETAVANLTLTKPTKETKVLGGVVHSKPTAVSYGAALDSKGSIVDPREDYALFGSMDGALHLVSAKDGKEKVAVIPRQMLINQPEALVDGSTRLNSPEAGKPYFGVDAPWLVTTDYKYDLAGTNKKVTVDTKSGKGMFAYGGLRMGGEAFYGLDISKVTDSTDNSPKALFTITPAGLNNIPSEDFKRLGQIWSKPVAAKIRLEKGSNSKKNAAPTDVIIFGGGYDMGYEEDSYVPTTNVPAKGNAIYMIDAKTGELIWSTSNKGTSKKTGDKKYEVASDMIHSITGGITVLDRDNDGLMDHLYAADLGGQVFRADFENARNAEFGFSAVDSFSNKGGVTRILNVAPSDKKYAYRFYESPVVSFYRRESGPDNGKLFAMVNVISGNRSAPLSTLRNGSTYANRVYGIIDNDVTNKELYEGLTKTIVDLTEGNLVNLGAEIPKIMGSGTDIAREKSKNDAIKLMIGAAKDGETAAVPAKNGWYYPLTRFDGYSNVRYNKGIGESVAINNLLYTTVYNPDKLYGNTASCAAKITGGSERQLYCLPYGVCMDKTSISGTGGYVPAGQGIQELAIGAFNKKNTDIKVLIGTTTISERIASANRAGYGADDLKKQSNIKDLYSGTDKATEANGDGSAVEYLFNERYTLQPKAWYERKKQ